MIYVHNGRYIKESNQVQVFESDFPMLRAIMMLSDRTHTMLGVTDLASRRCVRLVSIVTSDEVISQAIELCGSWTKSEIVTVWCQEL
jgi:hypothetical protein